MKAFWIALGAVGFGGGAAFVVFWVLAWTGDVPPGAPLAISLGVMLLVAGVFCFREAASSAGRGTWARSNVQVGRLSAVGFGLAFCAVGLGFVGFEFLTKPIQMCLVGAVVLAFLLVLCGQRLDARRARTRVAPNQPTSGAPQ